jgi:predicted acetyltransferase
VTWKPHLIEPQELAATIDLTAVAFGVGPEATPDYRSVADAIAEPGRTFAVEDGGSVVGTGAAFSFRLALPGGGALPMAGVSEVGVAPTHRRRGILRAIMGALIDQALERGEPVAGLTASEGVIYRRFGYGVATRMQSVEVTRARSAELVEHAVPGTMRLVAEDEAAEILPAVWRRHWPRLPGEVDRNPGWWRAAALDPEHERGGASARYVVVHDAGAGEVDGYAAYRFKQDWASGQHEVSVDDLGAADDAVVGALLRFLLDVDLVTTVRWGAAPLDLPLRWQLVDPRAIRVTAERDHLWLRPLDVARCLAGRRYTAEGGLVLEVVDAERPELGGRFRLDAGPGGAEAARTDAEPDLALAVPELGAVLLSGVAWATLARAGLVDERRAGALARADALFRPVRAPYCGTPF